MRLPIFLHLHPSLLTHLLHFSLLSTQILLIFDPPRLQPNFRSRKLIRRIPITRHEVHTQRITPRRNKESQWHTHGLRRTIIRVRRRAQQRRHAGSATDTTNDDAGPALRVLAEPAHAQRDDGREADGLEEERNVQHAHARVPALGDGGRDEDDAHAQVEQKDPSRPNKLHQADAREAAECEGALSPGEELGPERRVRPRSPTWAPV
ncbi:hypothetical protein M8818_001907 [Zalaria obscura]|uniref:Uncharacterized protein n=1 Tax=Zalaria obscura TaxID=2024903 RepID=A0ACC3SMY9_9PEZI